MRDNARGYYELRPIRFHYVVSATAGPAEVPQQCARLGKSVTET